MVTIVAVFVALLALLVFLLLGAVVELFRDVEQLRDELGIIDTPRDVELGNVAGGDPSSYELPKALDNEPFAIVLFLHEGCGTCKSLAEGLNGRVPDGLWLVIEARSREVATGFLSRHGLSEGVSQRVVIDEGQHSANLLGLDTTPVALRIQNGTIVSASTVPSSRYLRGILPNLIRLNTGRRRFAQAER